MERYRLADDVLRATVPGENGVQQEVLLHTATGQYHLLNGTGRAVLDVIESSGTTDDAIRALAAVGAPAERVREDVASFLAALEQRSLVERVAS